MSEELILGRILFIGAHPDDIEIGCGGTAAKFLNNGNPIAFATATREKDPVNSETRKAEATKAAALLGLSESSGNLFFGTVLDGDLNQKHKELREWLKGLLNQLKPDTVFVHRADDHSDHTAIYEVSKGVFENKNLFLYGIPRQAPDAPFNATCGIAISEFIEKKVSMCACHTSQRPIYISRDSVTTAAHSCYLRWFGATQMRADGFAEEFQLRAWRSPLESGSVDVSVPSMTDELHLISHSDGTFKWED